MGAGASAEGNGSLLAQAVVLPPPELSTVYTANDVHVESGHAQLCVAPLWQAEESKEIDEEEWLPIPFKSSRSAIFREEELSWYIGTMLPEGVLVKGVPLKGSWLGNLLAVESVAGCVCVLTSQMDLHVHDLQGAVVRIMPLYFGSKAEWRSAYPDSPWARPRGEPWGWRVEKRSVDTASHMSSGHLPGHGCVMSAISSLQCVCVMDVKHSLVMFVW